MWKAHAAFLAAILCLLGAAWSVWADGMSVPLAFPTDPGSQASASYPAVSSGPPPAYTAQGVNFTASPGAYASKTGAIPSPSTATSGLASLWFNISQAHTGTVKTFFCSCSNGGAQVYFAVYITGGGDTLAIAGSQTTEFDVLSAGTNQTFVNMGSQWAWGLLSWNFVTQRLQIYWNDPAIASGDQSDEVTNTFGGTSSHLTLSSGSTPLLGAIIPGGTAQNFLANNIADLQVWFNIDVDISVTANRRYFIDNSGNAVNPSVAVAQFGTPCVLQTGPLGSGGATWLTNQGSCGGFTKQAGTVAAAGNNPP